MSQYKYFHPENVSNPSLEHPRVHYWRARLADPAVKKADVELYSTGEEIPELYLNFYGEDGKLLEQSFAFWDSPLESWLLREAKLRAHTTEIEGCRFAFLLASFYRPLIMVFGEDVFYSALVYTLRQDFSEWSWSIRERLNRLRIKPCSGPAWQECGRSIEDMLRKVAALLKEQLKYDDEVGQHILDLALEQYLDSVQDVVGERPAENGKTQTSPLSDWLVQVMGPVVEAARAVDR